MTDDHIVKAARERLQGWLTGTFTYTAYRGKAPEGVPHLRIDLETVLSTAVKTERLQNAVRDAQLSLDPNRETKWSSVYGDLL